MQSDLMVAVGRVLYTASDADCKHIEVRCARRFYAHFDVLFRDAMLALPVMQPHSDTVRTIKTECNADLNSRCIIVTFADEEYHLSTHWYPNNDYELRVTQCKGRCSVNRHIDVADICLRNDRLTLDHRQLPPPHVLREFLDFLHAYWDPSVRDARINVAKLFG